MARLAADTLTKLSGRTYNATISAYDDVATILMAMGAVSFFLQSARTPVVATVPTTCRVNAWLTIPLAEYFCPQVAGTKRK